jgi:tetratricopeptide (TPR) repeat protein
MSPPYLNPSQTIYYLKEAVKYNPYQSYIHDDLGNFYLNLGRFKEAYEEIELAVKYFPANIKYKEDLEKVKKISKIK